MKTQISHPLDIARAADQRVLAASLATGVGADLAVRSGVSGLSGMLLVAFVSAATLWSGRVRNGHAVALVATAPLFGLWLMMRSSPWLVPLDVFAAAGLLVLGASFATGGSVGDLPISSALSRALHAGLHGLLAPGFIARTVPAGRGAASLVRGLALAAPIVLIVGVLLASADAVFASFFRLRADPASLVAHVVLIAAGAWGMAGLLRVASAEPAAEPPPADTVVGVTEAAVVVGAMDVVFAAFGIAQLVALGKGGRHVIETAGLTYAEYARSGFFQLLAVAIITLVVLLAVRAVSEQTNLFTLLSRVAVALTLVVVAVAFRRLLLYEQAFGLTMARLLSHTLTVWIGVVFVLLGCSLRARRSWFTFASLVSGLVLLFGLNTINPEALVVRHNVGAERLDAEYLTGLSDDALPALVSSLPRLAAEERQKVVERLCPIDQARFRGWAAYNAAERQAREVRKELCK